MELTSFQEHIQKYLYMWNKYHAKPAGDWKKTIRKIHTHNQQGRGRRVIRSEFVPLRGDLKEKGHYIVRHPPWRVNAQTTVLGCCARETSPLAGWRTAETNRRVIRCRNLTCEELIHWPASEAEERGQPYWLLCFP